MAEMVDGCRVEDGYIMHWDSRRQRWTRRMSLAEWNERKAAVDRIMTTSPEEREGALRQEQHAIRQFRESEK